MTITTNIGLTIVEESQNSKEVVVNNNSILLDGKLGSTLDIDVAAGGTIAVTSAQLQGNARLRLTGAPAGVVTLELASVKMLMVISNQSGQIVTVQSTATPGDTVSVLDTEDKLLYNTGAVGDHILDLTGGAGGSSLTVATVQTTNATVTTLVSSTLASGTGATIRAYGTGFEPATEDALHFDILIGGANTGGTSRSQGVKITKLAEVGSSPETTWDIEAIVDDTTDAIIIRVTGEAAKTIDWEVQYELITKL